MMYLHRTDSCTRVYNPSMYFRMPTRRQVCNVKSEKVPRLSWLPSLPHLRHHHFPELATNSPDFVVCENVDKGPDQCEPY
eukprot:2312-Pyramimonas_sp.AAC.2